MSRRSLVLGWAVLVLAQGCGPSDDARYDTGLSDGYAAGYNTTCQIRATLIEGDFDDEEYARGYTAGYASAAEDCRKERQ